MCSATFSYNIAKENNKPMLDNDELIFKQLEKYLPDIKTFYFAGGEPLIMDSTYKYLDYYIDKELNDKVSIGFSTNLSILDYKKKDIIGYWKKFRKNNINVSIDSIKNVSEYIRVGQDFDKVKENIKRVKQEIPTSKINIHSTVSIYSVWTIPDLLAWVGGFKYKNAMGLEKHYFNSNSVNTVKSPIYLNIQNLPTDAKKEVEQKYIKYINKFKGENSPFSFIKQLESTIKFMNRAPTYSFKDCINKIKYLDSIRGGKFFDICPELKKYKE